MELYGICKAPTETYGFKNQVNACERAPTMHVRHQ